MTLLLIVTCERLAKAGAMPMAMLRFPLRMDDRLRMFYDLEQSGIPFEPDDDHVCFDYDDGEFSCREYKREPQRPVEPTPRVRQGGSKAAFYRFPMK